MRTTGLRPIRRGPMALRRRAGGIEWWSLLRGDPYRLGLFALMILTVSRVHQHFGFISAVRPALLLGIFALGYAVLNPSRLNGDLLGTWPARILAAIAIMACISVPFGISIGNSGKFMLTAYSKVLLFAFLLIAAMRGVRDLALFVWGYVISVGVLAWMANTVFSPIGGRIHGMYTYDSNEMAVVLMAGLPLALLTFQTSGKRGRVVSGLVIVGVGTSMALSGSRGGFIGLMAVGAALILLLKRVPLIKRLGFLGIVVAALALAAPMGYWEQMETVFNPTEDYNWTADQGRKEIWKRGVGYTMDHPITGLGVGNFPRAEGLLSDIAQDPTHVAGVKWAAAHNSHLQVAAEMGFPGLALWLVLLVGGVVKFLSLRKRLPRWWVRGDPEERFLYYTTEYLPIAIIGFAVPGTFVSFAYLDTVYILAAFMAGFYVALRRKQARDAAARKVPAPVPRPVRVVGRPAAARIRPSGSYRGPRPAWPGPRRPMRPGGSPPARGR